MKNKYELIEWLKGHDYIFPDKNFLWGYIDEMVDLLDAFQHDGTPLSRLLEADDDVDIRQLSDGELARYRDNANNDFIDADEELRRRGL